MLTPACPFLLRRRYDAKDEFGQLDVSVQALPGSA